jgi:hypothetical protein
MCGGKYCNGSKGGKVRGGPTKVCLKVFNMQTVVLYISIQRGLGGRHANCAK